MRSKSNVQSYERANFKRKCVIVFSKFFYNFLKILKISMYFLDLSQNLKYLSGFKSYWNRIKWETDIMAKLQGCFFVTVANETLKRTIWYTPMKKRNRKISYPTLTDIFTHLVHIIYFLHDKKTKALVSWDFQN